MKLTINVSSEVEELLDEKCKKVQKEPSELVELLLEWYFLKRKKPEINEIGNANDFLKMADYCAKERMYNCKYSEIDNCNREVEVHGSKKPKPIHPYMCLFCSHFKDKREQGESEQEEEENKNEKTIDEQKIAKIAAGIVMEQYGNKLSSPNKTDRSDRSDKSDKSDNSDDSNSKESSSNGEETDSNEFNFSEFEEEIEEEPEEEFITRDKVEKLLEDW